MTPAERQLIEDRANRDAARAVLDTRFERVKGLLGSRSIGRRMGDEALVRGRAIAAQTRAVAQESRWIIAGAGVALAAWLLRKPLLRWSKPLIDRIRQEPEGAAARLRTWIQQKVNP